MIVFSTIAFHPLYRKISHKLIDTFLEKTVDCALVVITDDKASYGDYNKLPNVHIIQTYNDLKDFDLNLKFLVLQYAWDIYHPTNIVLMDCDAYLEKEMDNQCFDELKEGITVAFGLDYKVDPPAYDMIYIADVMNGSIQQKAEILSGNSKEAFITFKEGCLLFKTNKQFHAFIEEWKKIFFEVAEKKLTYSSQYFEVQIAAARANYPMNDLSMDHHLRNVIFYEERNGAIGTALK